MTNSSTKPAPSLPSVAPISVETVNLELYEAVDAGTHPALKPSRVPTDYPVAA